MNCKDLKLTQEHIKNRSKLTCLPREIRKHTSELIAQNNLDKAITSTSDLQQKKEKKKPVLKVLKILEKGVTSVKEKRIV